jgi:hypothetical protein
MSHQRAAIGFALTVAASMAAGSALAQTAPACDYLENQLIHTLCQNEVSISGTVTGQGQAFTNPLHPPSTGWAKTDRSDMSGDATVSVTPLSWLQVSVSSGGAGFDSTRTVQGYTAHGRTIDYSTGASGSYWGQTSGTVLANIYDTGPGQNRFLFNVDGTVGLQPGQANVHASTIVAGGAEFGDRITLYNPDYSLDTLGSASIQHNWYNDITYLTPELHLRLTNNRWGVSAGPLIYTNILVNRSPQIGRNSDSTFAGGEVLAQPFRNMNSSLLQAVTFRVAAVHTLGNAYWDDTYDAKASGFEVTGTVGLHFTLN